MIQQLTQNIQHSGRFTVFWLVSKTCPANLLADQTWLKYHTFSEAYQIKYVFFLTPFSWAFCIFLPSTIYDLSAPPHTTMTVFAMKWILLWILPIIRIILCGLNLKSNMKIGRQVWHKILTKDLCRIL